MISVCLIGDSHLAALKMGWPAIQADFPDVSLRFYAGGAATMLGLEVQDGALVAAAPELRRKFEMTSGGSYKIADVYDLYVLCGLGLSVRLARDVFRKIPAQADAESLDALTARLRTELAGTLMMTVLGQLRRITEARTLVVASPHPAEADMGISARLKRRGLDGVAGRVFNDACRMMAGDQGAGFLPQPDATLSESAIATDSRYARQPSRFTVQDPEDDLRHMNDKYGAIVLRAALSAAKS